MRHAVNHERDVHEHDDPSSHRQRFQSGRLRSAEEGFHARYTSTVRDGLSSPLILKAQNFAFSFTPLGL